MDNFLRHGDSAREARVILSDGSEVPLSGLWQQSNVLLVFLRHFG
ncbi:MAG: hypothetical protein SFH39_01935 [Candidatus Magnetobacterium sp. LHC-1]|nr:hypothetical protein [Candidatus Magnetobacterium casensis]